MRLNICLTFAAILFLCGGSQAQTPDSPAPATVTWDGKHLAAMKVKLSGGDKQELKDYEKVISRLRRATKEAMRSKPASVVEKDETPPSGDKHDYLSFSRYWWPDPKKKDGLPYIRKDGVVNRKLVQRGDREKIGNLGYHLVPLALSNYLYDDEKAGEHAVKLLRTWFLDPDRKMNPNLNFAQGVPGREPGRGVGIIDSRGFIWLMESVVLLESTGAISDEDAAGLRVWFSEFLEWLESSELGKEERNKENNHGSWFAAQAGRIAVFVGRDDFAKTIVRDVKNKRFPNQIKDDGSQPFELARTKPVHYCFFNLSALTFVAQVGDAVQENLWGDELRLAVERLEELSCGDKSDRPEEIGKVTLSTAETNALRVLALKCDSKAARTMLKKIPIKYKDKNFSLLQLPAE